MTNKMGAMASSNEAMRRRTAKRLASGAPREMKGSKALPSLDAIAWAAYRLHRLLFAIHSATRGDAISALDDVLEIIEPEINAAFLTTRVSKSKASKMTGRTMQALLKQLPAIQRTLLCDLDAAYEHDPAAKNRQEIVLCYPGLRALCIHRIAHALEKHRVPLIPRMLAESAHDSTGIDIHPGAQIGPGFFIDHGTSVVIGETSVIGRDCTIYQGVTLGAKRFDRHADGSLRRGAKRHPTLGDGVTVYANATILGGKTKIGNDSVIAAGVLVQESVPAGSLVRAPRVELTVARGR